MNIVVVGGSGFIGTSLCQLLDISNIKYIIVDKKNSNYAREKTKIADVSSLKALESAVDGGCAIVNLAAEHKDNVRPKSLYDKVNVEGAKNLCMLARERNINKIIFTSSVAVYGFAPIGTDETGKIQPFNDYGRTKWEAEEVFKKWYEEDAEKRVLVIIRPTVVFGENNRGNVYNLLKQVSSGKFIMVGDGNNRKSMAYVGNLASFIKYSTAFNSGMHVFNYVDSPDYSMNELVLSVKSFLGFDPKSMVRIPKFLGLCIGKGFDLVSLLAKKQFPISEIRIKKFCANSTYSTSITRDLFVAPVALEAALKKTVVYEFGADLK